MGRGRGKAKKQTIVSGREDLGSGAGEKMIASKRRGRPQKQLKDEVKEDELIDKAENVHENVMISVVSNDQIVVENGTKRRKKSAQVKDNSDLVKEENNSIGKSGSENSIKTVGFRQNGSRRKSKPRRAAEVGVECKRD